MSDSVQIDLQPANISFRAERGAELRNLLASHGVEFPCGGNERCGACRVRVSRGSAAITSDDAVVFGEEELRNGWRLGCHLRAEGPLTIEVGQWTASVLSDEGAGCGSSRDGLGIAVDLGTTTVVLQSVDLRTGQVQETRTFLNPQAAYGADIMSRVQHALCDQELTRIIREAVGQAISNMVAGHEERVREIVLVGNTVMHHLFCGLDVEPLSHVPFCSLQLREQFFCAEDLGWNPSPTQVHFLPCIGGFVGSDILAGIVAVGLDHGPELRALIDLGTNGEIAVGNEKRILCASTAAGTAFEAGNISMGMRAATGAISQVSLTKGELRCSVIGDVAARGLCGSGLVDAVACLLDRGDILDSGRFAVRQGAITISDPVRLTQADVRQLQLAKGAIAAGLQILLDGIGATARDLKTIYLSGAFGNYVTVRSALRIGLLPVEPSVVHPAGNTALRGAKLLLSDNYAHALSRCEHISLASHAGFQDIFAENMTFPASKPKAAAGALCV